MNIREFSHNLQKLYAEMSERFMDFQRDSRLPCLSGCGNCCLNPEIEATTLEMIPMALKILDEGKLEEWYEKLQNPTQSHCLMAVGNQCRSYQERPSVCRMFGVAGYYDKKHSPTLSICKLIKEEHPKRTQEILASPPEATPMMADWASKLTCLEPKLTDERQSINQALKFALEKVAIWSQYSTLDANQD